MEPILQIERLGKVYADGTLALKEVSFSIIPSEFIAVIGPSGAGISTLLRCINRLVEPSASDLYFDRMHTVKAFHAPGSLASQANGYGVPRIQFD